MWSKLQDYQVAITFALAIFSPFSMKYALHCILSFHKVHNQQINFVFVNSSFGYPYFYRLFSISLLGVACSCILYIYQIGSLLYSFILSDLCFVVAGVTRWIVATSNVQTCFWLTVLWKVLQIPENFTITVLHCTQTCWQEICLLT